VIRESSPRVDGNTARFENIFDFVVDDLLQLLFEKSLPALRASA
jgi:hypothetical protein